MESLSGLPWNQYPFSVEYTLAPLSYLIFAIVLPIPLDFILLYSIHSQREALQAGRINLIKFANINNYFVALKPDLARG
jgi:hypothetical protein